MSAASAAATMGAAGSDGGVSGAPILHSAPGAGTGGGAGRDAVPPHPARRPATSSRRGGMRGILTGGGSKNPVARPGPAE